MARLQLQKAKTNKYKDFIMTNPIFTKDDLAQDKLHQAKDNIKNHIYDNYTFEKQAQDEKWTSSIIIKLKASGVKNLELAIVTAVIKWQNGVALDVAVKDFTDSIPDDVKGVMQGETLDDKEAYLIFQFTKLAKIAIRTDWAESCLVIGKVALIAGKEPKFSPYPQL
jgi:hypothetical protein